ncbi:hypothetical protein SLS63_007911 [Diaporthe eres]|uniref:Uncharacterized protein n=1 Tax=Diaporthe eres TaxID=83184 RepID=A0ABR1P466_DIAER
MSSESESDPIVPHSWRRLQRKRRREQNASEEVGRRREWEHRNEVEEANGTGGRAPSPIITQHLNGNGGREQDQDSLDLPRQSPRLDVSDSDALSPDGPVSTAGVAINPPVGAADAGGADEDDEPEESDESDDANTLDEDNEADGPDNPSANFQGIRWISKKDLNKQRLRGVGVYSRMYQSRRTDALYFVSNLGEKIWLIDENGDGVLGQDQNMDQTTKSSSEEADP